MADGNSEWIRLSNHDLLAPLRSLSRHGEAPPNLPPQATMKPPNRKLGEPIPARLILGPYGTLRMADGSDPAKYLRAVRRKWIKRGLMQTGDSVPIAIIDLKSMERIEGEALLARNWPA